MAASSIPELTAAVRRFNRFYTARIGALGVHHLGTPYSLTEARLLYELGERGPATAAILAQALETDPAQVSRAVSRLERAALVTRTRDASDLRARRLSTTAKGKREFARLDRLSRDRTGTLLTPLSSENRARLGTAMATIEDVLAGAPPAPPVVVIRPHRPGDLGWVVSRHGSYYAEEYGWDATFEALVAGVAKDFLENFNPRMEACWMAEIDGQPVGSVCLVKKGATVAKLRLLIVDKRARGHGIGTRLVDECVTFARRAGYKKITLWTNSILDAARHLYEQAGFVRVDVSPVERAFGKDLVFETWELELQGTR